MKFEMSYEDGVICHGNCENCPMAEECIEEE